MRSSSLSIGQITFGGFLLVLAIIVITSVASVVAMRHLDNTFAELQRLDSVGALAEEIDRRMNELRLAARDYVTDPGAQSSRVWGAASSLNVLLKKTRIELAPDQQEMIDGVTTRLEAYRSGIERVTNLIGSRARLIETLPPLREKLETAIERAVDQSASRTLFRAQSDVAAALLGHDPTTAEQSAEKMRATPISEPAVRTAVEAYADAVIAISLRERQIADLDKDVLGTEGRLIGRVTKLLRELSTQRGQVLSHDFARTLAETRWQSIVLGGAGILIGLFAAVFVVRRTVRPLKAIAKAIRVLAGGEKDASIPGTDVDNEIGDIARAAEVFRRTLAEAELGAGSRRSRAG